MARGREETDPQELPTGSLYTCTAAMLMLAMVLVVVVYPGWRGGYQWWYRGGATPVLVPLPGPLQGATGALLGRPGSSWLCPGWLAPPGWCPPWLSPPGWCHPGRWLPVSSDTVDTRKVGYPELDLMGV